MFYLLSRKRIVFVAAGLSVLPTSLSAIQPSDILIFSHEPVLLRPQFSVTEVYSDNLFYQETDKISDFITIVSPGLAFQIGKDPGNFLSLGYTFNQLFYADRTELNDHEQVIEVRSKLQSTRFRLTGSDLIGFFATPLGGIERTATFAFRSVERTTFSDNYNLSYIISEKTGVYLEGQHSQSDYEDGIELYDLFTLIGTAGFAFRPSDKTSFFGEVYYGQTKTTQNSSTLPENPKATFVGGFIGARGKFTSKLTGVAKLGYEWREFSDDAGSADAPVVEVSLTHAISEKTSLSLIYSRRQEVSVQFTKEAYTSDIVNLELSQAFGNSGKWRVSVGGSFGYFDYEQVENAPSKEYLRYSANFNLAYHIQAWLNANLGYSFEKLDTDAVGLLGYDVNRVTLKIAVGY